MAVNPAGYPGDMLDCKGCGERMFGVNSYKLCELCEPCGGNKTEYHVGNPIPGGMTEKMQATS